MSALAQALAGQPGGSPTLRVILLSERLASELIELSTRHNFAHWLAYGAVYRGLARSASGERVEGLVDRERNRGLSGDRFGAGLADIPGA